VQLFQHNKHDGCRCLAAGWLLMMTSANRRAVCYVVAWRVTVWMTDRHHSGDRDWRRRRLSLWVRATRRHPLVQEVINDRCWLFKLRPHQQRCRSNRQLCRPSIRRVACCFDNLSNSTVHSICYYHVIYTHIRPISHSLYT